MAVFDPEIGDKLLIDGASYVFMEHPMAPGLVHAQDGKFGTIYRLAVEQRTEEYALKKLLPGQRKETQIDRNAKLAAFAGLIGLRVCRRSVLTEQMQVVQKYPDLKYSIKMPWVKGRVWSNFLAERTETSPGACLQLARTLSEIVCDLEKRGLAHCDLSSGNIVIEDETFQKVQLIDVEGIYWEQLEPLDYKLLGTPGYAPDWLEQTADGVYCQEGDRFAGAILLSEILCWQFPEIRKRRFDETSYFKPDEVGKGRSDRYKTMMDCLYKLEPRLASLLERTWNAASLQQCPMIHEWNQAILAIRLPILFVEEVKLDFGVVDPYAGSVMPVRQFRVTNVGDGVLQGTVQSSFWLSLSHQNFNLRKSESFLATVTLKSDCPRPKGLGQGISESAILVRSSGGEQAVMVNYNMVFPELTVTKYITFTRLLDRAARRINLPTTSIAIMNTGLGRGVLTGKVQSNVPWLEVEPTQFSLTSRDSTIITVTLNRQAPQPASGDSETFTNAISVTSNAGSALVSGKYTIQKLSPAFILQWILSSVLTFGATYALSVMPYEISPVLAILLVALLYTGSEWLILRNRILGSGWWIPATVFGTGGGAVAAVLAIEYGPLSQWNGTLAGVAGFFLVGLVIGLLQILVLRKSLYKLWIFLSATVLVWTLGPLLLAALAAQSVDALILVLLAGVLHGVVTGTSLWYLLRQPARQAASRRGEMVWLNWRGWESVGIIIGVTLAVGALGGILGSLPAAVAWVKTLAGLQIVLAVAVVGAAILMAFASKELGSFTAALTGFIMFGVGGLLVYGIIWLVRFMNTLSVWQNIFIISALTAIALAVFGKDLTFWERLWSGFLGMLVLSTLGYWLYRGVAYLGSLLGQLGTSLLSWLSSVLGTNWQTSTPTAVDGQTSYAPGIVLGFLLAGGLMVYLASKAFSGLDLGEEENPKAWAVIVSLPLLIMTGLFTNIAFTHEIPLKAGFTSFGIVGMALGGFFSVAYVLKEDYAGDLHMEKTRAGMLRFITLLLLLLVVCGILGRTVIDYAGNFTYVSARADWQSAGMFVEDGDLVLLVHVGGTWSADPQNPDLPFVGALGYSSSPAIDEGWKQYQSYAFGQLVAKVFSVQGRVYSIGLIKVVRFDATGTLYLRMNDASLDDNSGSIHVLVLNLTDCLR